MESFNQLLEVARALNDPEKGCPWDLEQTFASLRPYILEEASEAYEAIDSEDDQNIIEELGDLFYTVIFYAKVAEKEKRFSLKDIIEKLRDKLIRRHPHVFGEKKATSMQEVIQNWEDIKKEEKKERKSVLDGIPKTLSSLQKAHKMLTIMKKTGHFPPHQKTAARSEELAHQIYDIVQTAAKENIDIESAFRSLLSQKEKSFTAWELHATQP